MLWRVALVGLKLKVVAQPAAGGTLGRVALTALHCAEHKVANDKPLLRIGSKMCTDFGPPLQGGDCKGVGLV